MSLVRYLDWEFETQESLGKKKRPLVIITIPIPQSTDNIQIHPFQNNFHVSMVHCGSAFEPGASGLPYYRTSICLRSWCNWPQLIQWRWSLSTEARWAACSPHLLLSDSSKAHTLFHCSLSGLHAAHTFFWVIPQSPHFISPCLWVNPQSLHLMSPFSLWNAIGPGFSQKNLASGAICSKNIACSAIFSSKIFRQFVSESQFPFRK